MADDAAAAAAAAAASAAAKPWYDGVAGFDAEFIGHLQNRGWDKKPAAEAAFEALKAFKGVEKMVGIPADQVMKIPKDAADEAGWKAVWTRLGMPVEAKGYDFSDVKRADGKPVDDMLAAALREAAFKAHLPKDAATAVMREVAKYQEGVETKATAERTAKLAEQKLALKVNWGANEPANLFVAQRAAAALGIAPETVSALEGVIGYDKVMEMFRVIGSKIGEDKFITGTGSNAGGAMTREAAAAKKADLMSNKEWSKSYLDGDKEKFREMQALNIIISGVAA